MYNFFTETRKLESLRVVTDTSWLTAAARYANFGMGNFLQKSNDKGIQEIGKRLITADNIANDGFMFFSAGERHFQDRVLAGDNSPETVQGLALMRSALEKNFQSYYQELGGIYSAISNSQNGLGKKLVDYIKTDANKKGEAPSEGNFIGLMYKLYNEHQNKNNAHDAVPFVWGADGLTQFGERSGAEKFKLYRDQLLAGSLMEMLIESSQKNGLTDDASTLSSILNSMRIGSERDRPFLASKADIKYDTEKMPADSPYTKSTEKDIQAANRLVQLGNRNPVSSAWSTHALNARAKKTLVE